MASQHPRYELIMKQCKEVMPWYNAHGVCLIKVQSSNNHEVLPSAVLKMPRPALGIKSRKGIAGMYGISR
jgi:hypothetical protein